jgi:hypothetical protein
LGYKDFIDALRDTLYLLLNMDRIPKLLMTGPISPRPEPKMLAGWRTRVCGERQRREETGHNGRRLVRKAPNPIQGRMLYGFTKVKKEELNLIYQSVQELVEITEAQNLKGTFFYDQE